MAAASPAGRGPWSWTVTWGVLARPGFAVEHVVAFDADEALVLAAERRPDLPRPRVAFLAGETTPPPLSQDRGSARARWQDGAMARLAGRLAPVLSVREPSASADWYGRVFDFVVTREFAGPDGRVLDVCMVQRDTGIQLCLVGHRANAGEPFDESRTGLDHLEFLVDDRADLDGWVELLDALGVAHSGVKVAPASKNAMVTFRDLDNIQLELFWRAPGPASSGDGHDHRP
jgi:catechol 2,3-dioxygenase-like lactoylglutathione lyase family enzyme